MTCTLYGLSHAALVFEGSSRDAARQDLALLVEEFLEELGVLVIDVFDSALLKAAVFLLLKLY